MKLHLKRVISSIVMNPLIYDNRVPKIRWTSKRFPSGCGIAKWFPFCLGITKIFQTQSSNNGITKRFPLKWGTIKKCDSVPVTNGNRAKNGVRFPLLTGIGLRFRDQMRISGILKRSIYPNRVVKKSGQFLKNPLRWIRLAKIGQIGFYWTKVNFIVYQFFFFNPKS